MPYPTLFSEILGFYGVLYKFFTSPGSEKMEKSVKKHLFLWVLASLLFSIFFMLTTAGGAEPEPNVFNRNGSPVGLVDISGEIFNLFGKNLGSVNQRGVVFNPVGRKVGTVDPGGDLFAPTGAKMGRVDVDGKVFSRNGTFAGTVEADGNIYLIGGAAILITLKTR